MNKRTGTALTCLASCRKGFLILGCHRSKNCWKESWKRMSREKKMYIKNPLHRGWQHPPSSKWVTGSTQRLCLQTHNKGRGWEYSWGQTASKNFKPPSKTAIWSLFGARCSSGLFFKHCWLCKGMCKTGGGICWSASCRTDLKAAGSIDCFSSSCRDIQCYYLVWHWPWLCFFRWFATGFVNDIWGSRRAWGPNLDEHLVTEMTASAIELRLLLEIANICMSVLIFPVSLPWIDKVGWTFSPFPVA